MRSITSYTPTAARLFLGLIFTVFGLNGFVQFLPMLELTPEGGALMGAFAATGYLFPLIKGTEVTVGLLLLSNRFVPLALTLLAPISVNILLFHVVLVPAPALPLAIIAAQLYLAYTHRAAFAPMLRAKPEPPTATPRISSERVIARDESRAA